MYGDIALYRAVNVLHNTQQSYKQVQHIRLVNKFSRIICFSDADVTQCTCVRALVCLFTQPFTYTHIDIYIYTFIYMKSECFVFVCVPKTYTIAS